VKLWKAALICMAVIASSCNLIDEKIEDVFMPPEFASEDRTSAARYAALDLAVHFELTDYGSDWYRRELRGEWYYSLAGPTFYSEWNAIIVAFPSRAEERQTLVEEAGIAAQALKEVTKKFSLRLDRKQRMFVFFVDYELTQKLKAGEVISCIGEKERLTEEEFHQQFPAGEETAYWLGRLPDGSYLIALQSGETATEVSRDEAVEYVREHGPPWSYERSEKVDEETGETLVYYYVQRKSVNFEAADVPLIKLVRENVAGVVAVTQFNNDGGYEFTDDAEKISRLVGRTLKNEDEYHVDFF